MKSQSNSRRIAALGIRLGKLKSYSARVFAWGAVPHAVAARGLVAGGRSVPVPNRVGQDLQHRAPFASRLIEHFAVALGDLRELQLSQVAVKPCLEIVITSCHESPPRCRCRNGRKSGIGRLQFDLVDQLAPLGSGQSGRGKLAPPAFRQQEVLDVGGVVGRQLQGLGDGGKHLRRPVELVPDPASDAGGRRSSPAGASGGGGTGVPRAPRHQTHVPARCSETACPAPAPPGGGPATRSTARARSSGHAGPPPGPRAARGPRHGWRES